MFVEFMPLAIAGTLLLSACATIITLRTWTHARRWRRLAREYGDQVQTIRQDLRGLCAGAVGIDARVARMEQETRRLKERQEQLELRDGGERLYAQAIRMVHKGAGTDELVTVCGLSRNEAELIAMMHRVDKAG